MRISILLVVGVSSSVLAGEERPAAKGQADPSVYAATDGGPRSPGGRFLRSLPAAAREAVMRDGQAILDQRSSGSGPSLIRAVARFNKPRAEVFALIARPADQSSYLPHVTESRSVARTAVGESVDFAVSFLLVFKYRTQHWFYPEQDRVEWVLDPRGGDGLDAQEGFWQLYELDESTTIGEYGTRIVAKGAVINFFRSLGERGGILEALTAFRKHIDSAKAPAKEP